MFIGRRGQGVEDFARRRDPAELGGDATQRGCMKLAIVRRDGIRDDDGRITSVEGAMHSVFDTDLGDGAGDDQGLDALRLEDLGQDGVVEGAVSALSTTWSLGATGNSSTTSITSRSPVASA